MMARNTAQVDKGVGKSFPIKNLQKYVRVYVCKPSASSEYDRTDKKENIFHIENLI